MWIANYELRIADTTIIKMTSGCKLLHVGEQHGKLFLWAVTSVEEPSENRKFCVIGTGPTFSIDDVRGYIGTVQMADGLVWHVFEVRS